MNLEELGYKGKKLTELNKHGINTVEDYIFLRPKKYYYFDEQVSISKDNPVLFSMFHMTKSGKYITNNEISFIGKVESVKISYNNNRSTISAKVKDSTSSEIVFVNFIGQSNKYDYIESLLEENVIVGGKVSYTESPYFTGFSVSNPVVFSPQIEKSKRIYPVYRKYKGISEEFYKKSLNEALKIYKKTDLLPSSLVKNYKLLNSMDYLKTIHAPQSRDSLKAAEQRTVFEKFFYFAASLKFQSSESLFSDVEIKKDCLMKSFIDSLPYSLTADQKYAIEEIKKDMGQKKVVNALVQGDVGCGKTVIAESLCVLMSENDYQSVLIAPTLILAKQHYDEIREIGERFGIETCYLGTDISKAERKKALSDIKEGKCKIIIGTHSCFSEDIEYRNLGLVIIDEEHKFGVKQKESIRKQSKSKLFHTVYMSATPIPRTLATSLYSDNIQLITINSKPSNRKPIQTAVCNNDRPVLKWVEKELKSGNQAYVVCPLIDEAEEESTFSKVSSLEEKSKIYKKYFEPLGYKVGIITGKLKKEEQLRIKNDFSEGKIQVLLATTIIEVGINVPNATCIVISGAERFGIATLQQLRGRVGRGEKQSYCILQKSNADMEAPNVEIVKKIADGMALSEEDFKNRGAGNIIGEEQSGKNFYLSLIEEYPKLYAKTKEIVNNYFSDDNDKLRQFICDYEERFTV